MWKCKQPAAAAHRSHPQRRGSGGIYIYWSGRSAVHRAARPDPCPLRPEPQVPTNRSAPPRRRPAARRAVPSAVVSHWRVSGDCRHRSGRGVQARVVGHGLALGSAARPQHGDPSSAPEPLFLTTSCHRGPLVQATGPRARLLPTTAADAPSSPRLCGSAPAQTLVETLSQVFYSGATAAAATPSAAAADANTAAGGSVTVVEAAVAAGSRRP